MNICYNGFVVERGQHFLINKGSLVEVTHASARARDQRLIMTILKRVFDSLQERAKLYLNKTHIEIAQIEKTFSLIVFSALIPISILSTSAAEVESKSSSKIVFDKTGKIVDIVDLTKEITPGESRIQAEERAKAEAENARLAALKSKKTVATTVSVKTSVPDPVSFDGIYQSAGAQYGIDWRILKAVHYVETGCSGSTSKANPSGATGPMQFIPSTWRHYGVDGNGDGVVDITNVSDAIYAAANYLSASGGAVNNYKTALWSYNPSSYYYSKVMGVASSLGF